MRGFESVVTKQGRSSSSSSSHALRNSGCNNNNSSLHNDNSEHLMSARSATGAATCSPPMPVPTSMRRRVPSHLRTAATADRAAGAAGMQAAAAVATATAATAAAAPAPHWTKTGCIHTTPRRTLAQFVGMVVGGVAILLGCTLMYFYYVGWVPKRVRHTAYAIGLTRRTVLRLSGVVGLMLACSSVLACARLWASDAWRDKRRLLEAFPFRRRNNPRLGNPRRAPSGRGGATAVISPAQRKLLGLGQEEHRPDDGRSEAEFAMAPAYGGAVTSGAVGGASGSRSSGKPESLEYLPRRDRFGQHGTPSNGSAAMTWHSPVHMAALTPMSSLGTRRWIGSNGVTRTSPGPSMLRSPLSATSLGAIVSESSLMFALSQAAEASGGTRTSTASETGHNDVNAPSYRSSPWQYDSPYGGKSSGAMASSAAFSFPGGAGGVDNLGRGRGRPPYATPPYAASYCEVSKSAKDGASLVSGVYAGDVDKTRAIDLDEASEFIYHKLGITHRIGEWGSNVRFWLAASVVKSVAAEFRRCMSDLAILRRRIRDHDAARAAFAMDPALMQIFASSSVGDGRLLCPASKKNGNGGGGAQAIETLDRLAAYGSSVMNKAVALPEFVRSFRSALRPYLIVGDPSNRDTATMAYVQHRLCELAEGEVMTSYRWDGGGKHQRKEWAPHLPTDSQIVMHAFALTIESVVPDARSKLFFDVNVDPSRSSFRARKGIAIAQVRAHPEAPYYIVSLRGGADVWLPPTGRTNVFEAIALWVYASITRAKGRIGEDAAGHLSERPLSDLLACVQ